MLTHLAIRGLTLAARLDLTFGPGMSVITGETGAGKSILLGALGLALGDRADASLLDPEGRTEIGAGFELAGNPEAMHWLAERELADGEYCILRRVITKDGKSRAFVNGGSITLAELRRFSDMLLDVHSQHEHQSLLKRETQARLLDEFGGLTDEAGEVASHFDKLSSLRLSLARTRADAEEQSARVQLLDYQAEELTALALQTGEVQALEEEQKRLGSAAATRETLAEVLALCGGEEGGASQQAARALRLLSDADHDLLEPVREMLTTAAIQLNEAAAELPGCMESFDADPARLTQVEERLSRIYETARKHRVKPEALVALTVQIRRELDAITNADARIVALEQEVAQALRAYRNSAEKLTLARKKTADKLEAAVTRQLRDLGMRGAGFAVSVAPGEAPGRQGADRIEWLISTLPGRQPGPLARIASGGELSRISLAIQAITARTSNTPTLVFDEVDAGIGGATAEVVGAMLRRLGGNAQVICVTHLPQVAAQGHHHYVVTKSTTESSASTSVTALGDVEKVHEIARMLGGVEKTDQSLAHAEAMLASVQKG